MTDEEAIAKAEVIRAEGNAVFRKEKFGAAIDRYTEGIAIAPRWHVLYVNRAVCYRKLGKWDLCERDCRKALELSSGLMKANYFLGVALRHQGKLAESAGVLEKALEAAREQGDSIKDDIWRELAASNYLRWREESQARTAKRDRMAALFDDMFKTYYQHKQALPQVSIKLNRLKLTISGDEQRRHAEDLASLMEDARKRDEVVETDGAFTCHLTMEPYRDPVCTPSGQSYERHALLQHFQKNGYFDPISRSPMNANQVIPNIRLRSATQAYLNEHPWAWEECMDELYTDEVH